MKILVTGASGFLGRALIESLLAAGERDLRALVRPRSARPGQVEICEGTLGRAEDLDRALEGVGFVHHLAAAKGGAVSDIFLHTVVGTKNFSMGILRWVVTTRASSATSGAARLEPWTTAQSPLSKRAWYLFSPCCE